MPLGVDADVRDSETVSLANRVWHCRHHLHHAAPNNLLSSCQSSAVHNWRDLLRTYHEAWEIQAWSRPVQDHVAWDFEEQVSDEEDGHCEGVVRGAEMERLGLARLFGIANALQMLSATLERTSYLTRTCFDQGLELAVTGQQVQPRDTLNRHSMALTVQNVLVSMSARSSTPRRPTLGSELTMTNRGGMSRMSTLRRILESSCQRFAQSPQARSSRRTASPWPDPPQTAAPARP